MRTHAMKIDDIVKQICEKIKDSKRPILYTDDEKFRYLVEKNPFLINFKNQFKLEYD